MILKSRTLSISINCPPKKAYEFVSSLENLPKWRPGFATRSESRVPRRVFPNSAGSEAIFTLFRLPDMSDEKYDEKYDEDARWVERGSKVLKEILEREYFQRVKSITDPFRRRRAVFLILSPFEMDLKEKLLVDWVGLRGAVPIILATFPLLDGLPQGGPDRPDQEKG